MPLVEYTLDADGRLTVHNDTAIWYRYIDLTAQAEALSRFIDRTIDTELAEELAFLTRYDAARKAIQEIVDMPDRQIDLFIRFCSQNDGRLSARKRASHFGLLSDEEVESMERAVQSAWGDRPGRRCRPGVRPCNRSTRPGSPAHRSKVSPYPRARRHGQPPTGPSSIDQPPKTIQAARIPRRCAMMTGDPMFDSLAIVRQLTAAGIEREQADAIADAVRQAADHGDHVTADQFTAGLAALELRLIKWIIGTGIAVTGAVVGLLRLLGLI